MQRPTKNFPGAPVVLLLATLAGCSPSTGMVERGIENELPRVFGPADQYDVHIQGLKAGQGYADRVTATGWRVQPEGAPVIDRLDVELHGVTYDRDRKRLSHLDSARAVAWIQARDLSAFLERQDGIRSAEVTLEEPDSAVVRLRPDLGGLPLPRGAAAEVHGRIEGRGPRLRFDVSRVDAAGFGIGGSVADRVSDLINPLVDLSDLPVALNVTDVRVEGSRVRIEATADASSVRPGG